MCADAAMADEKGRRGERERAALGPCAWKVLSSGMGASRWEGYNERLAIFSINIFRRFAQRCKAPLVERSLVATDSLTFPQSIERPQLFASSEDLGEIL